MFVTKKRLYTELCKVTDVIHDVIDVSALDRHNRKVDINNVMIKLDYLREQLLDLTDRVDALEKKKAKKVKIKITTKTKRK